MRVLLPGLPFLLLTMGCPASKDTDTGTDDTGVDTDTTADTDTGTTVVGDYTVAASVAGVPTAAPLGKAAAGLCAELLDPTSIALGGTDFDVVTTATVGKDGSVVFTVPLDVKPALGMLINLDDCKGAKDDRVGISSNTGVLPGSYENAKDGDIVTALAFVISPELLAGMQLSLEGIGYTGSLSKDGFFYGFALASVSPLTPAGGVTIDCKSCEKNPTYYLDPDAKNSGLFATDGVPNASTSPLTGQWIVPGGPISSYSATDTAKKLTFADQLNGSAAGAAVITAFIATN